MSIKIDLKKSKESPLIIIIVNSIPSSPIDRPATSTSSSYWKQNKKHRRNSKSQYL